MSDLFGDESPGTEGAVREPEDASRGGSGGQPLPYPTTADGKSPWPAIYAEIAAAGGWVPPRWRSAVAKHTGKQFDIGDEIY